MKVINYFRNYKEYLMEILYRTAGYWNDSLYLRIMHLIHTGSFLNLKHPKTYSEKCQWMKLYYQRPELTMMVDKYDVKGYVMQKIGKEYVVDCYGVWDSFDEIDFDKLPNQFALKCTHNSGGIYICKDKRLFDKKAARAKLEPSMYRNYYLRTREWAYKNVKPRILAEKYIETLGQPESIEYKITCMGGGSSNGYCLLWYCPCCLRAAA